MRIVSVVFNIMLPWLFMFMVFIFYLFLLYYYKRNGRLSNISPVDAIHVFITPLIGIISLLIIYLGFESQIEVYKSQTKQWEKERKDVEAQKFEAYCTALYNDIVISFENLEHSSDRVVKDNRIHIGKSITNDKIIDQNKLTHERELFFAIQNVSHLSEYLFINRERHKKETLRIAQRLSRIMWPKNAEVEALYPVREKNAYKVISKDLWDDAMYKIDYIIHPQQ